MISLPDIRRVFKGKMRLNEPLGSLTSFGTGGACDYFFEPLSPEDAQALVRYLDARQVPYLVVARGSNLLVSDDGFRGAGLSLERGCSALYLREGAGQERLVVAGAGNKLARVIDFSVQHGIAGLEAFAGIPGTVAGGLVEALEEEGCALRTLVEEVMLVRGGEEVQLRRSDDGLALRTTGTGRDLLLSVHLRLKAGQIPVLLRRRRDVLLRRNALRPLNMPGAGVLFRDPRGNSAATLLRQAGCAGMRVGQAVAAEAHPNYILSGNNARSADVLALAGTMQRLVRERTGVELALLARPVGFSSELLTEVA